MPNKQVGMTLPPYEIPEEDADLWSCGVNFATENRKHPGFCSWCCAPIKRVGRGMLG